MYNNTSVSYACQHQIINFLLFVDKPLESSDLWYNIRII